MGAPLKLAARRGGSWPLYGWSEGNCFVPAGQDNACKITISDSRAEVFSRHRNDERIFPAPSQHLLCNGLSKPVPRNQKAKRASSIAVLDLLPEHHEFVLAATTGPVLALRQNQSRFTAKPRLRAVVNNGNVYFFGLRSKPTGHPKAGNRLKKAAREFFETPAFIIS